jgi:hypothetical protein
LEIIRERLCSNVLYISYKAAAAKQNNYKGFSLYFEMRPLGPDSGCSGVTPTAPPVVTPTTPFVPINPSTPQNASEAIKFQVCKGKSLTINAPNYNLVYIEEINLRVQTIVNTVCLQITYLTPPPPSKKKFLFY